jgi:hypothetical protein
MAGDNRWLRIRTKGPGLEVTTSVVGKSVSRSGPVSSNQGKRDATAVVKKLWWRCFLCIIHCTLVLVKLSRPASTRKPLQQCHPLECENAAVIPSPTRSCRSRKAQTTAPSASSATTAPSPHPPQGHAVARSASVGVGEGVGGGVNRGRVLALPPEKDHPRLPLHPRHPGGPIPICSGRVSS